MVIGNGLMASAFVDFKDQTDKLIFASGVSNSKTSDIREFERERELLLETILNNQDKLFIYFSTCSVYDHAERDSLYVHHKLEMESLVSQKCTSYCIYRISNVVGNTKNLHTIFNFLARHITQGLPFSLWKNAFRNIIDVRDVLKIATHLITHGKYFNQIVNIANPQSYRVVDIVERMEKHFGKKGQYALVDRGTYFKIDTSKIEKENDHIRVNFSDNYIDKLLHRYYEMQPVGDES